MMCIDPKQKQNFAERKTAFYRAIGCRKPQLLKDSNAACQTALSSIGEKDGRKETEYFKN